MFACAGSGGKSATKNRGMPERHPAESHSVHWSALDLDGFKTLHQYDFLVIHIESRSFAIYRQALSLHIACIPGGGLRANIQHIGVILISYDLMNSDFKAP